MSVVFAGKYVSEKKIGSGAFGEIFLCSCTEEEKLAAVKVEHLGSHKPQLQHEARVIQQLYGAPGLPVVLQTGVHSGSNIMVMELLGPSLEALFRICGKQLSLKTVLMLADQMLCRAQYVHSKNYLHRDIKPENFLIGLNRTSSVLHIVDFGLAKLYRSPNTHRHIPYKEGKSLTGTPRYASVNTHLGIEQSRRDDLEGIAYILIYLLKGCLPWQGLQAATKEEKHRRIREAKLTTPIAMLCSDLPPEFGQLVTYARTLSFEQEPDYSCLRRGFKELLLKQGFEHDYVFDWTDRAEYQALIDRYRSEGKMKRPATPKRREKRRRSRDEGCTVW